MYTHQELLNKLKNARDRATRWASTILDAYQYITPGRNALPEFFRYIKGDTVNFQNIYDATAEFGIVQRANQLVSMLMPTGQRWAGYTLNPKAQTTLTEQKLQDSLDTLYYFINNSNLGSQIRQVMVDEGITGGALLLEETPDDSAPFMFQSIPGFCVMPEYYCGDEIRDAWYPFSVSPSYVLEKYPLLSSTRPDVYQYMKDNIGIETELFITRGLLYDPDGSGKKYRIVDILEDMASKRDAEKYQIGVTILSDQNYVYDKLAYIRDDVRPGEVIGYGPGMMLAPIVKRLNELCYLKFQNDRLRLASPVQVNTKNFPFRTVYGQDIVNKVFPLNSFGAALQLPEVGDADADIIRMRSDIQIGLSINPFGSLEQPVRTATEISARVDVGRMQSIINTARLQHDASQKIFYNMFILCINRGLLPNSAEIFREMNKNPKVLLFNYRNPLQDIQNNNDASALVTTLNVYQQYVGQGGIMAGINMTELQNTITRTSNLKPTLFNSGQMFSNAIEQTIQAAQQQGAAQQGQQGQGSPGGSPQPTTAALTPQSYAPIGENV